MKMLYSANGYSGYKTFEEVLEKEVSNNLLKAVLFLMKNQITTVDELNEFSENQWYETEDLDCF